MSVKEIVDSVLRRYGIIGSRIEEERPAVRCSDELLDEAQPNDEPSSETDRKDPSPETAA